MIYRKWGSSVRWENGVVVRVEEAGEAWEENGVFYARPLTRPSATLSPRGGERVREAGVRGVALERIVIVDGIAEHEYGDVRWTEETHSFHAALTRKPWRVFVDDAGVFDRVAEALERCEGERDVERIRLTPTDAILRRLNIPLEQQPGGRDGNGRPIERRLVEGLPPNVYRPSYRVRPIPLWLNLSALPFGAFDESAAEALALVDAAEPTALVEAGDRVFIARLRLDRVTAVSERGDVML